MVSSRDSNTHCCQHSRQQQQQQEQLSCRPLAGECRASSGGSGQYMYSTWWSVAASPRCSAASNRPPWQLQHAAVGLRCGHRPAAHVCQRVVQGGIAGSGCAGCPVAPQRQELLQRGVECVSLVMFTASIAALARCGCACWAQPVSQFCYALFFTVPVSMSCCHVCFMCMCIYLLAADCMFQASFVRRHSATQPLNIPWTTMVWVCFACRSFLLVSVCSCTIAVMARVWCGHTHVACNVPP